MNEVLKVYLALETWREERIANGLPHEHDA